MNKEIVLELGKDLNIIPNVKKLKQLKNFYEKNEIINIKQLFEEYGINFNLNTRIAIRFLTEVNKTIIIEDFKNISILFGSLTKNLKIVFNQKNFDNFDLIYLDDSKCIRNIYKYLNNNVEYIKNLYIERSFLFTNIKNYNIKNHILNLNNIKILESASFKCIKLLGKFAEKKYKNINIFNCIFNQQIFNSVEEIENCKIENNVNTSIPEKYYSKRTINVQKTFVNKSLILKSLYIKNFFELNNKLKILTLENIDILNNKKLINTLQNKNLNYSFVRLHNSMINKDILISLLNNIKETLQIIFNDKKKFILLKESLEITGIKNLTLSGIKTGNNLIFKNIDNLFLSKIDSKILFLENINSIEINESAMKYINVNNIKNYINIYEILKNIDNINILNSKKILINSIKCCIKNVNIKNAEKVNFNNISVFRNINLENIVELSIHNVYSKNGQVNFSNIKKIVYSVIEKYFDNRIQWNKMTLNNIESLNYGIISYNPLLKIDKIISFLVKDYLFLKNILSKFTLNIRPIIKIREDNFNSDIFYSEIKDIFENNPDEKILISRLKNLFHKYLYYFIKNDINLPKLLNIKKEKIKNKSYYKINNI